MVCQLCHKWRDSWSDMRQAQCERSRQMASIVSTKSIVCRERAQHCSPLEFSPFDVQASSKRHALVLQASFYYEHDEKVGQGILRK